MAATRWQDLIVSDPEGEWDPLAKVVANAPANLDSATITDGRIVEWPGFFLAAPGEEPDWNTPRGPVDWTGFEDALHAASGHD